MWRPPATPRPPPFRSPWSGCWRRGRRRAATPRSSSDSERVSSTQRRSLPSLRLHSPYPRSSAEVGRCATTATHRRRSAAMAATQEEILEGLAEIVNEIAGIPTEDVLLDKSFTDDLDVDSLSMVEVVVAAEERFDVKIPDDDVKNLKTVGDAVAFIERAQG